MMYDNTEKLPRAILVAVDTGEYDAETSLLELEELARRIYGELERREYFLGTLRRHVSGELIDGRDGISCSIGIACGRVASVQDVNRLLLRADNMLYEAKKGTKGIYFVSHE